MSDHHDDTIDEWPEQPARNADAVSRRTFTKVLGAGASALALGSTVTGSAAARQEQCGAYDRFTVGDDFELINNPWGATREGLAWDQCVWTDDTTYGATIGQRDPGTYPNYPEALLGTKPWGDDTGVAEFPIQRRDVEELTVTFDVDQALSGEDYNLALEWWLTAEQPPNVNLPPEYEIMLVLDAGEEFGHGLYEAGAWTDQFGNTIDWWEKNLTGGTSADFHQFAISGGADAGRVDLARLIAEVSDRLGVGGDMWLSGVELGTEYYSGVTGDVTYNQFDVTINGTTYTSGPDAGSEPTDSGDTSPQQSAYNGPHDLPGRVQAEDFDTGGNEVAYLDSDPGNEGGQYRQTDVDIGGVSRDNYGIGWIVDGEWWEYTVQVDESGSYDFTANVASGSGGGAFHVEVDGQRVIDTVSFGETGGWGSYDPVSASGFEVDSGEHVVRIVAEAGGWNLDWFEVSDGGDSSDSTGEGLLVTDYSEYPDGTNDLGNWAGAGDFENDDGEVVDGALKLDYAGSGWYGELIDQDISAYSRLVVRIRGASGGEEDDFTVGFDGGRTLFSEVADGAVGTSFSELAVPLDDLSFDPTEAGQLTLNFWQGADSTVWIDEIRLV